MHLKNTVLDRKSARNQGMVVIEAGLDNKTICLDCSEFATVELKDLALVEDAMFGYGIVATAKSTKKQHVVLEATAHNDADGYFFVFASETIVAEAVKVGRHWVLGHLKEYFGIDPKLAPERFKLKVKHAEKAIVEQFLTWVAAQPGWVMGEKSESTAGNGVQQFVPVKENYDVLVASFLGVDYDRLVKEQAKALLNGIPPAPKPIEEAVVAEEGNTKETAEEKPLSWLFGTGEKGGGKKKRFNFFTTAKKASKRAKF